MKLHKDRELFSNAIHATAQEFGMAPEFYDLYYLRQDNECIEYLNTVFPEDLIQLIIHDKTEFDRPPKWKNSDVLTSPLFRDFKLLWNKVAGIYNSEMGALSYGTIPTSDEIQKSASRLFEIIKACIEVV